MWALATMLIADAPLVGALAAEAVVKSSRFDPQERRLPCACAGAQTSDRFGADAWGTWVGRPCFPMALATCCDVWAPALARHPRGLQAPATVMGSELRAPFGSSPRLFFCGPRGAHAPVWLDWCSNTFGTQATGSNVLAAAAPHGGKQTQ